jgi:hypothetical protein
MDEIRIGKQGGWLGIVVLLLALVIGAYLARDALRKYGLLPDTEATTTRAGTPAERAQTPVGGATEHLDPTGATPAPTSPIDRARSIEGTLQKESEKRGGGY